MIQAIGVMAREPTETADLSMWEFMVSGPKLGSLHGTNLGPLHVCDSCIIWSLCKAPSCEIRTCPWPLAGFWEPVLHNGLLCPAGAKSCLNLMCYVWFVQSSGRPAPFRMEMVEEWKRRGVD